MEKRTLLAIVLSFLVIFLWSKFVYRPAETQQTAQQQPAAVEVFPKQTETAVISEPLPAVDSPASTREYSAFGALVEVAEPRAAINKVVFDAYKNNAFMLHNGLTISHPDLVLVGKKDITNGYTYVYENKAVRVTKSLYSTNSIYNNELEVRITNLTPSPLVYELPIILGRFDLEKNTDPGQRFYDIVVSDQSKISHPNYKKPAIFSDIKFIGMRDQYFCLIVQPESTGYSGIVNKVSDKAFDIGIAAGNLSIQPGAELVQRFKVYLGPQDMDIISKSNPNWGAIVYYGMFDIVAQAIFGLLKFIYTLVRNWGLAIIFLSIAIYVILFPLTIKQMKSMKEMQILQPKMEQLRKQYGDNQKKLNEEMMKLYKEHKVNPFSGCLPMILQIPIFIALYQVLSRAIALKGASFLWIKDLSEPDRLFKFPTTVPFIGEYFNILPILMAIGMLIQQKMSSVNATGQQAEQQKIMMVVFPIMFGVMFYNVPAGLVMYWFLNSTLMLIYQIKVMKAQ